MSVYGNVTYKYDGQSTWTYGYDGINRVTSIGFPRGASATVSYTTNSRTFTRSGLSETTYYDAFGNVTSVTRGGIAVTYGHDAMGLKTFQSMPGTSSGTSITYDAIGRIVTSQSPAGTRRYSYSGGAVFVTDELGRTTRYDYERYGNPDEGFVVGITPPAGAPITMSRNTLGILLSATQNGVTRTYGRDSHYYLQTLTQAETGTITFGRDGVGNMTSKSISGGPTTSYVYDGMNRVTSITASPGISVLLSYSPHGQATSVSNGVATRNYSYDGDDNLLQDKLSVDGYVFQVDYDYDAMDGLSSVTYPMNKKQVFYSPDSLGRPTQVSPYVSSVSHYSSGNVSSITFGNGVGQSYGEDYLQRPSSVLSSSAHLNLSYGYDNVGNVTAIQDSYTPSESRSMGYDGIDRLTSVSGPWGSGSITYDGGGNITSQTYGGYSINYSYAYNRVASITGSAQRTYTYDYSGNAINDGSRAFQFDPLSQLTCASCGTADEADYRYDGQGHRVSEAIAGNKTYFVQATNGDLLFEYTPYRKSWKVHAYLHGKRVATEAGSDATPSSVSVVSSAPSASYGQSVTFTATVAPSAATGTVEFIDGDVSLGIAPVAGGTASITTSAVGTGAHTITANYSGDANYQPATGTVSEAVAQASSSVSLAVAGSQSLGGTLTLTAAVSGADPNTNVTFFDGVTSLGTVAVANGNASLTYRVMSAGSHSLSAQYLGDANVAGSASNTMNISVPKASSSASVAELNPNAQDGQVATFTVTVSGVTGIPATGSVTLYDGASPIGTLNLSGGAATFQTAAMTVGTHSMTATYVGDGNYLSSTSAPAIQNITGIPRAIMRSLPPELLGDSGQ